MADIKRRCGYIFGIMVDLRPVVGNYNRRNIQITHTNRANSYIHSVFRYSSALVPP